MNGDGRSGGTFAPLRLPLFRSIWLTSLISNFGHLMLGVAAAWEMTRLTDTASMVALVQTAMMLPLMLVSVPAGAVADMFDRRKIALTGLGFSMLAALVLTLLGLAGLLTPWLLLAFCALIGAGVALYSPAWQASIREQVPPEQMPAAIALGTISYNVARSFGPAVGGVIVLAFGAQAAFGINALFYAPLFIAFLLWRRQQLPARLPPERLDRAILSGVRYALYAPSVRNLMIRAMLFGAAAASAMALAPLVARDLLGGSAGLFGMLLGALGAGAVVGALLIRPVRDNMTTERATTITALISAAGIATIGLSRAPLLTGAAMFLMGSTNVLTIALLNVGVQMSVPRWVTARALSLFSAAFTGGVAIGAWGWGLVATDFGVTPAFLLSAVLVTTLPLIGLLLRVEQPDFADVELAPIQTAPDVALGMSMRSGPVTVEIDYVVEPERARDFYDVMRRMQRARLRRGAFSWGLARDIGDPSLWTERLQFPTWGDYLRQRSRFTHSDRELQVEADRFHAPEGGKRVRLRLERPFGPARRKADQPDHRQDNIGYTGP